jgi:hypothetical protein
MIQKQVHYFFFFMVYSLWYKNRVLLNKLKSFGHKTNVFSYSEVEKFCIEKKSETIVVLVEKKFILVGR